MPQKKPGEKQRKMVAIKTSIQVNLNKDLKDLVWDLAEREGTSLSEYIVGLLAEHVERPELNFVPRKTMGRPRKEKTTAS